MDKKNLTIGIFVTISLILGGAYIIADKDNTYYCKDSNLIGMCEKISSGLGTRCYYNNTQYKICPSGWIKPDFIDLENKDNLTNNPDSKWLCDYRGCEPIKWK